MPNQTTNEEAISMVKDRIINPSEPRHYMRLKSAGSLVRIWKGGDLLAQTENAIRLLEVGRDLYDPILYVPLTDLKYALVPVAGKKTHCPLKGDASYFALSPADAENDAVIAWTYAEPFDFASELAGHVAFYGSKVRIEEIGKAA